MDSVRELKADALNTESKYVSCPYNSSHRILKARLQYHLVKCRRNFRENPEEEKVICPLDATHHINKEELAEHMKVCPNRKIVDSERYLIDSEVPEPASSYKLPEMPPCEENWDDPSEQSYTYDPTPHLENQPILRTMHGATKSERKAFRQVERMKMIQFHSGQPMDTEMAAAAVGVTIDNGRFMGRGRGQSRLLGQGLPSDGPAKNKMDLNMIVGDGEGHTFPCPVEVAPLRPPRGQSIALRLAQCTIKDCEDGSESPMPPKSLFSVKAHSSNTNEKSNNAVIVSGSGLKATVTSGGTRNDVKPSQTQDWWEPNCSSSHNGDSKTVNLEEYKQRIKESQLAAKMGLSTDASPMNDDERARDFTYLDDEWQIQGRRGRVTRGAALANQTSKPLVKGRNW